jgi:hypothetical protein
MVDIRFQFETMAAIASPIAPMKKVIIAMLTIQSEPSAIERATAQSNWILVGYILALLLAAAMTYLSWKAGNRVQDAIRNDANARIAESNAEAKKAGESAGLANERAQRLEHDNLMLRGQVATLETKAAEAANENQRIENEGKERVARVEAEANRKIEEARNQADVKIAEANKTTEELKRQNLATERRLEEEKLTRVELEESFAPRMIRARKNTIARLSRFAGTLYSVEYARDISDDSRGLANAIDRVLAMAGWKWIGLNERVAIPRGVHIEVKPADTVLRTAADALAEYIEANGHDVDAKAVADVPTGVLRLRVGMRYSPEYKLDKLLLDEMDELMPDAFPGPEPQYLTRLKHKKERRERRTKLAEEWFISPDR